MDAPTNRPEPANQHEGDREELRQAYHTVSTHDVQRLVALVGLSRLPTAQQRHPTQDRACVAEISEKCKGVEGKNISELIRE